MKYWRQLHVRKPNPASQPNMGARSLPDWTRNNSSGLYIIYFHSLCVVTGNSSCLVFRRSFIIQKACSRLNFKAQQGKIFKLNGELTRKWIGSATDASRPVRSSASTTESRTSVARYFLSFFPASTLKISLFANKSPYITLFFSGLLPCIRRA